MEKQQLRTTYKNLRANLSDEDIEQMSLDIANQLLKLDIWNDKMYHLFLSIDKQKEIQTSYILNILQGKDKDVIISKSDFKDYSMKHFLLTDNTAIKVNKWGIPEPIENGIQIDENKLDVIFIPLLVCDKKGNRIGYGKGFYDRFLKKCRPNAIKIGLSFFHPLEELIDTTIDDVRINMLVCPDETFFFT